MATAALVEKREKSILEKISLYSFILLRLSCICARAEFLCRERFPRSSMIVLTQVLRTARVSSLIPPPPPQATEVLASDVMTQDG